MSRLDREWAIKLDLLESIASSQRSLAVMLEQAATVTTAADLAPAVLREHIRSIAGMQEALLTAATGMRWSKPRRGSPGMPWLHDRVCGARGQRTDAAGGIAW